MSKAGFVAVAAGLTVVSLQGCGGGGGGGSTTTTTTTRYIPPRTAPLTAQAVAEYLNKHYMGFDETDESSPLGVTVSMAGMPRTFYGNVFCSSFDNPLGKTECFNGGADCRMSASLFNHKIGVNSTDGRPLLGLGRTVGIVFNQTKVEEILAKCSFIFDGASNNRYNRGCGDGAPGTKCSDDRCAFYNKCPSTGETCTTKDIEVQRSVCSEIPGGGDHPIPPTHDGHPQCLFPDVAFDYRSQPGYKKGKSYLREMVKARVARTNGSDDSGPNIEKWNEVVIDELLMLPELWNDPATVIPAIIYAKHDAVQAKQNAIAMRDEFSKLNFVGDIPIIEVEDVDVLPKGQGPFMAPSEDEEMVI